MYYGKFDNLTFFFQKNKKKIVINFDRGLKKKKNIKSFLQFFHKPLCGNGIKVNILHFLSKKPEK